MIQKLEKATPADVLNKLEVITADYQKRLGSLNDEMMKLQADIATEIESRTDDRFRSRDFREFHAREFEPLQQQVEQLTEPQE